MIKKYTILSFFLLAGIYANAKIWLPGILSDHMVLQQNSEAVIWGWTSALTETITVSGSWDNKEFKVEAYRGTWSLKLPTPEAGGPFTITIRGHESISINDILIGEVWLCSGQSNMEWSAKSGIDNAEEEIKNANDPEIRFFTVNKAWADYPQQDNNGEWVSCTPDTFKSFSAVGYFFGRELRKELKVPIGLINSSWGGTPIEVWIPGEEFRKNGELVKALDKIDGNIWRPKEAGTLFNYMINPISKYRIAGTIWYQGEGNRVNADSYYESFPLLINSWRTFFGETSPFYFVQISPFKYADSKTNREAAFVRDAQLHTLKTVSNTGMVVTNDIGNVKNVHPSNKQEVGHRLALWALVRTYGVKDLDYSGPIYKTFEIKGNKAMVSFEYASKLVSKEKELSCFEIAGSDKVFYPAKARIKGNKVQVWSNEVDDPKAVRFAFTQDALPKLFDETGLPASAFRTDNW